MPLIETTDLREMFDVHADVQDGRLERHIGAASRRLRGWVGAVAYDDALNPTPADQDRQEDFKLAEAHLAMHFACLGLNTQIRPAGIVKTEKVEGHVVHQYLSPSEVGQLAEAYLNEAKEIVAPYDQSAASSSFEFVGV